MSALIGETQRINILTSDKSISKIDLTKLFLAACSESRSKILFSGSEPKEEF